MDNNCPICGSPTQYVEPVQNNEYYVDCFRCGKYRIDELFHVKIETPIKNRIKLANISGWIREHQNELIDYDRLQQLFQLKTPSVNEKSDKILKYAAKKYPVAGDKFDLSVGQLSKILKSIEYGKKLLENLIESAKNVLPLLSISWTQSSEELGFILYRYLRDNKKYFIFDKKTSITPAGWSHLESLNQLNPKSKIAFIAMKFEDDLLKFCDKYFYPGVYAAGYKPERINDYHHNNLIDDEISSLIRQSKFIVADFTGNSNGVYFETGFARGLNIPIICLCRKNFFKSENNKVHFDLNHYSFILWEEDNGLELTKALQLRIESTMGKGNYIKPENK